MQKTIKLFYGYIYSTNHWICTSQMESSSVVQVMDSLSSIDVKTNIDIILQIATIYHTIPDQAFCSATSWDT